MQKILLLSVMVCWTSASWAQDSAKKYWVYLNESAVDFIIELQKKNFMGNYAKELANYGLDKGSQDNITVIIYFFN